MASIINDQKADNTNINDTSSNNPIVNSVLSQQQATLSPQQGTLHPVEKPTSTSSIMASIVIEHSAPSTNTNLVPTPVTTAENTEITSVNPTAQRDNNLIPTEDSGFDNITSRPNLE